uniref:Uncharacterized protein n=1 Tax=Arundo donax TaxID=35708 RepID=A0A0A8YGR1_ARUDO
MGLQDDPSAC